MATTKKTGGGAKGGGGAGARPRLKSSHGGLGQSRSKKGSPLEAGTAVPRLPKPTRALPRGEGMPRVSRGPGVRTRKPKSGTSASAGAGGTASDAARELAIAIAIAALEKKAVGLEILDVAGKVDYADFLVIMTGRSDRQVQALAQGIEESIKKKGTRPLAVEGLPRASWVLMDFGDVVVHVFQDDARSLYDIEGLWMDARRIPVPVPESP